MKRPYKDRSPGATEKQTTWGYTGGGELQGLNVPITALHKQRPYIRVYTHLPLYTNTCTDSLTKRISDFDVHDGPLRGK